MRIKKKKLSDLQKCYALAPLLYRGEPHFLVASELEEKCLLFDLEGNQKCVVWEKPGGVMSMVQVPGTDGQFLATHKFYSFNDAAEARISIVTPKKNGIWEIRTLAELPFVHRIDIVEQGGVRYLIACTLKSGHEYDDDWRFPGKIYTAILPEDLSGYSETKQLKLTALKEGLVHNHGYCRIREKGINKCLVTADNGVFCITPPYTADVQWTIETLASDAVSDAVLADFDGDGEAELGVIAPFHGNEVRIYKKNGGRFETAYSYEKDMPFCHAIYGGVLCGKQALVIGHRGGERELLALFYDARQDTYTVEKIDSGCGPANILHFIRDGKDILVAANRETDEIAMYELEA